ncbi:hypothetical protein NECAME_18736, partial [Necator americanus]
TLPYNRMPHQWLHLPRQEAVHIMKCSTNVVTAVSPRVQTSTAGRWYAREFAVRRHAYALQGFSDVTECALQSSSV